jgi:D-proline reductase (dithiol) PrdB
MGISIVREFSEKVKPPRTIFLNWPFGHPLGKPFNIRQQRAVIIRAFNALYRINDPGAIIDLPFEWERNSYDDYEVKRINPSTVFKV